MKKRLFLLLLLVALPSLAWADGGNSVVNYLNGGSNSLTLFTIPPEDQSQLYLGQIFGSVGSALHGAGSELMGEMFVIFNLALLSLSGFFAGMMGVKFITGAAQDGSPMQKLSSVVPVRMVFGVGSLVPSFNGYSSIQVMVMWIVMQGVGMANSVWDSALNYLNTNNGFFYMPQANTAAVQGSGGGKSTGSTEYQNLVTVLKPSQLAGGSAKVGVAALYQSAVCLYGSKDAAEQNAKEMAAYTNKPLEGPTDSSAIGSHVLWGSDACYDPNNPATAHLKNLHDSSYFCFPKPQVSTIGCGLYQTQTKTAQDTAAEGLTATAYGVAAARQAVNDILSSAQSTLNSAKTYDQAPSSDKVKPGFSGTCSVDNPQNCLAAQSMLTAASDYMTVMRPYLTNVKTKGCTAALSWIANAENEGWLMAGMFYHNLVSNQDLYGKSSCGKAGIKLGNLMFQLSPPDSGWLPSTANAAQTAVYNNSVDLNSPTSYPNLAIKTYTQIEQANQDVGGQTSELDPVAAALFSTISSHQSLSQGVFEAKSMAIGHYSLRGPANNLVAALTTITGALTGLNASGTNGGILNVNTANFNLTSHSKCQKSEPNSKSTDPYPGCWASLTKEAPIAVTPGVGLLGELYAAQLGQAPDPILSMRSIGMTMMNASIQYWTDTIQGVYETMKKIAISYAATMTGVSAFGGLLSATGLGGFAQNISSAVNSMLTLFYQLDTAGLTLYLPLGAAVTAPMFILGVTMGIYVPFIPFLLFTFGVIGWFMAVIEAMVAAPLVALGVTHPEGHDLLGQSQQAVMLLVSVFVRPASIIIGFFGGIILTYISMRIFNLGFLHVLSNYVATFGADASSASPSVTLSMYVGILGMLIVYTYAAMSVVDQCFSLIYQLPEKIMRWIGGPQEQSQAAQRLGEVKGGVVQQTASPMAQGAAQGASQGAQFSPSGGSGGGLPKSDKKADDSSGKNDAEPGGDSGAAEGAAEGAAVV